LEFDLRLNHYYKWLFFLRLTYLFLLMFSPILSIGKCPLKSICKYLIIFFDDL
jgi:hypothetical protein